MQLVIPNFVLSMSHGLAAGWTCGKDKSNKYNLHISVNSQMSGSNPWKQDKRLKINSENIKRISIYFLIWKTLVLHETMSCPISTKPHNPDVDDEIAQYKNRRAEAVEEEYVGTTKWRKEREMSFLEKPSQ